MSNDTRHFLELLWGMTEKELRVRYKHTIFGFVWLVANPILQMLIIGFIFPLFVKDPILHFNYYLLTGLLIWNFFSLSLAKTTPSFVNDRTLIKKSVFPKAVIPISIILSNTVNYLVAFCIFLIPIFFLGTLTRLSFFYFSAGFSLLLIFTIGISLLTATLNVRYRDVNFFVQALLIIWFYATPIVYSLSQIPPRLLWLWRFNPLTSAIQLIQHALVDSALPGPFMIASNTIVILFITLIGILTFKNKSKNFDDWL